MMCSPFLPIVIMPCCSAIWLLHLDFDVAAGREGQVHQAVDSLGSRLEHVDQALMDAHLELFAALLIDMGAFDHRKGAAPGRQWDRSGQAGASAQRGIDNLFRGLVDTLWS